MTIGECDLRRTVEAAPTESLVTVKRVELRLVLEELELLRENERRYLKRCENCRQHVNKVLGSGQLIL